MKRIMIKLQSAILLASLILAAFPITAFAASQPEVVIGNNYTLESGQTLNDNLFILGGSIRLMSGSIINGNVFIIGGSVQSSGIINGNITVLGGTLNLASSFILNGNLTYAGTVINRVQGAQINGQINTNNDNPDIILPGGMHIPNMNSTSNPSLKVAGFFLGLFIWALVAMLFAMFLPNYLNRTAQAIISQPLISGGLGFLTVIILPIILVLLAITICLIPVAIIGVLLLLVAWAFGLITLGFEVGKRISAIFKREWHSVITAGLGTLLLMIVLNGLQAIIPCVGWIPKALVGFIGLGAVLLTQFGRVTYPPPTLSMPSGNPAANPPPS